MSTEKKTIEKKQTCFTYKNRKLVRADNVLCFGNPDDKYVVLLEILNKKDKIKDIELSDKISIALFDREALIKDPNIMFLDFCERYGLYDALETAYMWLTKDENKDEK